MPVNIEKIFDHVKNEVEILARERFKDNVKEAKKDGQTILNLLKAQLKGYIEQLENGELTKREFKDLMLGQKGEFEMAALKRAGIMLVEADRFKTSVLNLIINTVTGFI